MNEVLKTFKKIIPPEMEEPYLPGLSPIGELLKNPPVLPPVIIENILRQGWKAQIASGSGAGKSFLLLQLAIAIANGDRWLNFQCSKGKVLFLNLEIDEACFVDRMDKILKMKGIKLDTKYFDLWNLRGFTRHSGHIIDKLLTKVKKGNYSTVIIDPIYKLLQGNENSNYEIKNCLAFLDEIVSEGPSVAIVHHFSKGSQGGKAAMDRNSGAGVFARDPDTMITLTPLAGINHAFRIETAKSRNFAPIQPVPVRFEYPIHIVDESLRDKILEGERINQRKKIPAREALKIFEKEPIPKTKALKTLQTMGCSERGALEILDELLQCKMLDQFGKQGGTKLIGLTEHISEIKK